MPRRQRQKNRKDSNPGGQVAQPKGEAFNPALRDAVDLTRPAPPEPQIPSKAGPSSLPMGTEDLTSFLEAMADVMRLKGAGRRVAKPIRRETRPSHPPNAGDLEVMAHLADLVSGQAEMDITFSDEYMEGCVKGFDQRLMKRLKEGLFPVQDHVDLHGLTRQEAELRVTEFLLRSYRLGFRCVLVVHGRGLNSEDHVPVLKEQLPLWLNRGPVKRIVLAFCTARPYDGGAGAIYVLLRQARGRGRM